MKFVECWREADVDQGGTARDWLKGLCGQGMLRGFDYDCRVRDEDLTSG